MVSGSRLPPGNDPRLLIDTDDLDAANVYAMPQVSRTNGANDGLMALAGVIGVLGLGGLTWMMLSNAGDRVVRRQVVAEAPVRPSLQPKVPPAPSVLPPIDPSVHPESEPPQPLSTQPPPQSYMLAPQVSMTPQVPVPDSVSAKAPALVIDNSSPSEANAAQTAPSPLGGKLNRSANDTFLAAQTSDVSQRAWKMSDPSKVVPQGAVIAAVLETAINSDLPGYTRAIVSRDVRSFDGATVLIPRGSRLIGQYKSGLTTGETRAFIIWNRLIRPDGLSVQLASPATDELGQAGATGRVDSHFAKRFGSAILLSVVNGISTIASGKNSSTIVIGSSSGASGVIGEALSNDIRIPPTIRVPSGAPIQVFAARDLDFSQ